jgi:hypothetical protein
MHDLPELPYDQPVRLGVLNEHQVAEAYLRGVMEDRPCRWCGADMAWTVRGAWVCIGLPYASSCDFPRHELPEIED